MLFLRSFGLLVGHFASLDDVLLIQVRLPQRWLGVQLKRVAIHPVVREFRGQQLQS